MNVFDYIVYPFAWIMRFFYNLSGSYVVALVVFTLILRAVMLPSSISSMKTQAKNMFLMQKQKKIQEKYNLNDRSNPQKYRDNQLKANEELQRLYAQEQMNPMSGCLPMLLPLIILWPVYRIMYQPLTYLTNISAGTIEKATKALKAAKVTIDARSAEFGIIHNIGKLTDKSVGVDGFVATVKSLDLNFFGLDLTVTPQTGHFDKYWIIPILAAVTSLIYSIISQLMMRKMNGGQAMKGSGMGMMLLIMPLVSLWMCFTFPAGLGVYWILSNVIGLLIQIFINNVYSPRRINARNEYKLRQQRIERESKVKELKAK